jgi:hypothetical protein
VRRALSDSIWLAALGAAGLGAALAVAPGSRALAADVYVLVVGALALLAAGRIAAAAHRGEASAFDEALRHEAPRAERPKELERLEREVTLAGARAWDLHFRMRPALSEIASHRLAPRGIDLEEQPDAAAAALGPDAWELLRPDRPPPADRIGPGLPLARLTEIVTKLEGL